MSTPTTPATTPPAPPEVKERRRVRAARAVLARVQHQRDQFATAYGAAATAQQRFNVVAFAVRAAAAPGRHQPHPDKVAERLDAITDLMKHLLDELFAEQTATADKAIEADKKRIARNERRRGCDGRTTTHPTPKQSGADTAAA